VNGLFVTATDTGVGKTVVTAGLALAFAGRGVDVAVSKPFQSGNLATDPEGDAMRLKRLARLEDDVEDIVAYAFPEPLAPLVAARRSGVEISPEAVVEHVRALAARHEAILVEGAGGLAAPLADAWTVADLAGELRLPLLVVARPGLGTVNHTVLTVSAARSAGLAVAGVVLNGAGPGTDRSVETNAELIESFARVPVLGVTPWLDGELTTERLRGMILQHVDVEALEFRVGTAR
jgi:dethiobiotin synthetase